MRNVIVLAVLIVAVGVAGAGELQQGDRETTLRASFADQDLGNAQGVDLGSVESTDLSITYGWMLTDHHELGIVAGYSKEDIDGGTLFVDEKTDGTRIGGFYNFNFNPMGKATPYVGAVIGSLGGDLGDAYDFQYGVEVGVKVYPFEHGGVSVGLGYSELKADAPGLPDSDTLGLGVGLLLKY